MKRGTVKKRRRKGGGEGCRGGKIVRAEDGRRERGEVGDEEAEEGGGVEDKRGE